MTEDDDKKTIPINVDTFVNYKDQSLAMRVQIGEEITNTVMRVQEQQTIEALKMLGWHAPLEVPEFSDEACHAAQDVYNVTPVVFGDRARRMRVALVAAFQQHIVETMRAVERRAEELEQKFAPKPAAEAMPVQYKLLFVSPDGSWRTSDNDENDLSQWHAEHDDHATLSIPAFAPSELCEEIATLHNGGAPKEVIDDAVANWMGG